MIRSELEMPDRLKTDTDTLRPNYAKYTAEPFERGFGTTLGNSLRRVLLSSIKGAAIIAIQIEQVKHEYATIPGVVEDVVQIVLNLKEIRLNITTDDLTRLTLTTEGSGEVTAADIRSNANVEIINPDQHIATLNECEGLDIEIYAQTGRGYSLAEEHRPTVEQLVVDALRNKRGASLAEEQSLDGHDIGLIPIDAKFSPVEKVNFWVEETRVGDMTNFDKLNLEVWTDATITAKEAVTRAANILLQQLEIFTEFDESYVEPEPEIDEAKLRRNRYLAKPVSELELSVRASNCLETANIKTIRELVTKEEKDMLEYKNFGRTSLNEIKEQLANMGLTLGMKLDDLDDADISEEDIAHTSLQPPV